jgi:transcriptional regulator with XRE-family HTH domain
MPPRQITKHAADVLAYVAANLQRIRTKQGLTQEDMVDEADLDLRHYRRIERGDANLSLATLVTLADVLDVTPSQLLRRAAPPPPPRKGRPPGRRHRRAK